MPTDTPALGRFGHHPDPTIDFCVEVEEIDAIHYDVRTGIAKDKEDERNRRISRAMSFRVGGDEKAVAAKDRLRVIEREAAPPNPVAEVVARLREAADIMVAEAWDPANGWRCAIGLSTGHTLLTTPREMRRLADSFSKAGPEKIAAAGITEVIANMYDVARVVKRRIENHEVPADVVRDLPAEGSA